MSNTSIVNNKLKQPKLSQFEEKSHFDALIWEKAAQPFNRDQNEIIWSNSIIYAEENGSKYQIMLKKLIYFQQNLRRKKQSPKNT